MKNITSIFIQLQSGCHRRGHTETQCRLRLSLSSLVLVALGALCLVDASGASQPADRKRLANEFSLNNRGQIGALKDGRRRWLDDRRWSSSQRRIDAPDAGQASDRSLWSQPDPRRTFSPMIGPIIELTRAGPLAAGERVRFESARASRRLDSQSALLGNKINTRQSIEENYQVSGAGESPGSSAANLRQQSTQAPAPHNGVVTLVKYVPMPVLVSLSPEQLIPLSSLLKANQAHLPTTATRLVLAKQLGEHKIDIEPHSMAAPSAAQNLAELDNESSDLGAHSQPASAYIIAPDVASLPMAPAKLAYLTAPLQAVGHVSGPGSSAPSTSKALTAYASKLMSMLKPSALLSSMTSNSMGAQPYQAGYLGPMPSNVYLIASPQSSELVQRPLQQHLNNQHPVAVSTGNDLLLNQATRLHAQSAARGRNNWQAVVQPSASQAGLICLHGLARPTQAPVDPYLSLPSPTSSSTESSNDLSSFDYVTNASEAKKAGQTTKGRAVGAGGRESPAKLAHKLTKKVNKSSGLAQSQQELIEPQRKINSIHLTQADDEQVFEQQHQQQQSLSSDLSTRHALQPKLDTNHSSVNGRGSFRPNLSDTVDTHGSIIPFTIRDKIDSHKSVTSSPVQFDEPAEDTHLEPANQQASDRAQWLEEKAPSRTSFVANRKRKPQIEHESINYKKVVTQGPEYQMPMLMASSSINDRQAAVVRTSSGDLASVTTPAPAEVTTSSTLDGQPVTLASGKLSSKSLGEDQMILVSSSHFQPGNNRASSRQVAIPPPPSVKPSEILVNSTLIDSVNTDSARQPSIVSTRSDAPTGNHQSEAHLSGPYSHDKLLTIDNSMDEFARISAALQTDPLDLIDLQNSRSSFELPSQLESLSMFQQYAPSSQARSQLRYPEVASSTGTAPADGRVSSSRAA